MPYVKRIVAGVIKKDYSEGQVFPSTDVNTSNTLFEEGVNRNFEDIQKTNETLAEATREFRNIVTWLTSVDYYDQIATTYPTPKKNEAVAVLSTGITYLWDGLVWKQIFNFTPINLTDLDGGWFGEMDINTIVDGGTF